MINIDLEVISQRICCNVEYRVEREEVLWSTTI